MQAKFGITKIPRSIETACENARLAEEHGLGHGRCSGFAIALSRAFRDFERYRWRDRARGDRANRDQPFNPPSRCDGEWPHIYTGNRGRPGLSWDRDGGQRDL